MPVYEFLCQSCHKPFTKVLTFKEYDQWEVKCPGCGSHKVTQKLSTVYAVTSKKS